MIEVGQTIGNYRITAKLGEGGMGVVFLAEHPVIGRKVALKAIHPELSRNPEVVSRFMTEAKSVNQIGNEHIVDVNDFGNTADGEFYFIMEFLQGESLSDRLRRERLFDPNRALAIAAQVADALAASHEHGIIHRDLKPENIFLINRGQTRDFVKVLDFGLAKLTQGEEKVSHKTRTGSVMGTPYYMAPEQCEGRAGIDHRADIYSLGVILFEMMTGSVPFGGEGYGEIIVKHLTQPPPSPRSLNPMLSPVHEAIVLHALAKPRDTRFQTMASFRAAMLDPEGFASEAGPRMPAPAPGPPTPVTGQKPLLGTALGASGIASAPSAPEIRKGPIPSTFRHGAGELIDDDLRPARSRRGLVVGAVLAMAAIAGAAAFVVRDGKDTPTTAAKKNGEPGNVAATAGAPAATSLPVGKPAGKSAAAPVAQNARVRFTSDPEGAEVSIKGSAKSLGVTPFEAELPVSKKELTFVFRKAQFEERSRQMAPDRAAIFFVDAALRPLPAPPAPTAPVATRPSDEAPLPPAAATTKRPASKSGGRTRRPAVTPPPIDNRGDDDDLLKPGL